MIPLNVRRWLLEKGYGEIVGVFPVGGGCIHHAMRLETQKRISVFLKTNPTAPVDLFAREAEGLHALSVECGPRVPAVYLYDTDFLLLEDLSPGPRRKDYWYLLGVRLAGLHQVVSSRFGFEHDNYIGSTPQPNAWEADGFRFYAQQRLLFQAQLALEKGLLDNVQLKQIDRLAWRLKDFIPVQPASLLHGDLWSGNMLSDRNGNPAIIDPAAYYGWAEAELAMMELFGSLPESFYQAYQSVRPVEAGFKQRYPIYNLYHLLNHLNLFGGSYSNVVGEILNRFS